MSPPSPGALGDRTLPAIVFAIGAAARVTYLAIFRPPLEGPYLALADSLVSSGVLGFSGVPSTSFEPIYPALLATGRILFGDRTFAMQIVQACIAAAGGALTYAVALRLTSSRRTATIAGLMFALHPLLIRQAAAATDLGVTAALLAAFVASFLAIGGTWSAAASGAWLGLTILTRSMAVPLVVLSAVILALRRQPREAAALALTAMVCIAPMVARSYALSGAPWPGRSGINLFIGNSPHTSALLPTYDLDLLEPDAYERFLRAYPHTASLGGSDAAFDAFLTGEAISYMRQHPWATVRQKLLNVVYMLSPRIAPYEVSGRTTRLRVENGRLLGVEGSVPRRGSEVASHAVTSLLLLVGGAAGVYLRRRDLLRSDAILWAIFGTFVVINAVYVPATRYTGPMQFVLIFYAAVAFARLVEGLRDAAVA